MTLAEIIQIIYYDFFLNFIFQFNYATIVSISSSVLISNEASGLKTSSIFSSVFSSILSWSSSITIVGIFSSSSLSSILTSLLNFGLIKKIIYKNKCGAVTQRNQMIRLVTEVLRI